ncbi:MAG: SDR family NAD(P)-dependent oxidoreductase [Planctomycetota bacterium]|jgi:3-oxoacyl-[acyl-carrier protein] reductase
MVNIQGTALVTAGSRGLGAEIVRQLARCGAHVAFTYLRDSVAADRLTEEVAQAGARCLALQADASDFLTAEKVIAETTEKLGSLDILVCNAGIARSKPIWKMNEADWDDVLNVSLKGAFNYIRAIAPVFMEQQSGKIVCIGSINALRGRIGSASYNAAKAGLLGLVKTAAAELGRYKVNVNLVMPGFIDTPSQVNTPELIRDLVLKECAIKRLAVPEDIAPMVVFLCSESAHHVTGQEIKVDAGQYL